MLDNIIENLKNVFIKQNKIKKKYNEIMAVSVKFFSLKLFTIKNWPKYLYDKSSKTNTFKAVVHNGSQIMFNRNKKKNIKMQILICYY